MNKDKTTSKKDKPWANKNLTYQEFAKLDFDWNNEHKLDHCVRCYLHYYNNFEKGKKNEFILKSTFGRNSIEQMLETIEYWFNASIGAYSEIEINLK